MRPALFWDITQHIVVESSWNGMAHGDAREGEWRRAWRMEWVASTLHTTSEHGVPSITTADAHTSASSSRLNWRPRRFKWTRPFRRKTKSDFCACAITFQTQSRSLRTLRENLSVPSLRVKNSLLLKMGPLVCREASVRNYNYRLGNIPEQRTSQAHIMSPSASQSTAIECLLYWGHPYVEPRLTLTIHTPAINASQIKSRPLPLVRPSTPCCCQVYCFRPRSSFFPNLPLHWFIRDNFFFLAKKLCILLHSHSIFIEKRVIILVESLNRSTKRLTCTKASDNQVRWDETRWDEMRWVEDSNVSI
jgi:hypothetical protein